MFVILFTDQDNKFLGQLRADGSVLDDRTYGKILRVLQDVGRIYQEEAIRDSQRGIKYPDYKTTMERIEEYLGGLSKETR